MGTSQYHKGNFYLSSFYFYTIHFINAIARHSFFFLSLSKVLFSYVLQISKDEITFWTGGEVSNMLIHPKIKLLIVTDGSEGFMYHTKVSLPKSFHSDFNCLHWFYNPYSDELTEMLVMTC